MTAITGRRTGMAGRCPSSSWCSWSLPISRLISRAPPTGARAVFSSFMMNTWIAATVVAVIAGVTGFFAVLRGSTFAAHAIPNGAFAGAAGAGLLGLNVLWGLAVFALGGALGIGALGGEGRGRK